MNAAPGPFRWTVDEYEKMIRLGILTERHNVELIRGEIVLKMSKGDFHAYCVNQLTRLMSKLASDHCYISVQNPILLGDSEPEPDIALLKLKPGNYRDGKPKGDEVILVIEVADSSLTFDREVKRQMYATNGIPEYWIVNLTDSLVEIFREPRGDGTYSHFETKAPGQSIQPSQLPHVSIELTDIL